MPVTLRLPGGDLDSPAPEELHAHFPDAGDDRICLPRLGNVPARVLINLADLDQVFPDEEFLAAFDRIVHRSAPAASPPAVEATRSSGQKARSVAGGGSERGKPGPKTDRTAGATKELLRRLNAEETTPEALEKTSGLSLSKDLGVGETAALKARKEALAQFRDGLLRGTAIRNE